MDLGGRWAVEVLTLGALSIDNQEGSKSHRLRGKVEGSFVVARSVVGVY